MSRATSARYGLSGLLWEAAVTQTLAHPTMWIKVNTSRLVDILDPLCVEDVKFARVWTLNCWLCRQTGCRSVSIVTVTIAGEWQRQNTAFSLIHILLHVLILSVLLLKAGRALVNHNTRICLQLNWGALLCGLLSQLIEMANLEKIHIGYLKSLCNCILKLLRCSSIAPCRFIWGIKIEFCVF